MNCCRALLLPVALVTTLPLAAHGGQYRGPGDGGVAPPTSVPGPGPGSPATAGGAASGGAGSAATGGAAPRPAGSSSAAAAGISATRGAPVGDDLTRWQYWWEWNKDPFLRVKEAVQASAVVQGSDDDFLGGKEGAGRDRLRPTAKDIETLVVPVLRATLAADPQRDVVSGCMVALAKIARAHPGISVIDQLRPHLRSHDQEIRETAALAMGIARDASAISVLIALMRDDQVGRELCGRSHVDERTRSFAAYGLGLIAGRVDTAGQYMALEPLLTELDNPDTSRDLQVAVINALRLLGTGASESRGSRILRDKAVEELWAYFDREHRPGHQVIRAHALPAIAQLVGVDGDAADEHRNRIAATLRAVENSDPAVSQAAAIALGMLCRAEEDRKSDAVFSGLLRVAFEKSLDHQTRYFAMMALGKIGGAANRAWLLARLDDGSKALVKPWAASALGAMAYRLRGVRGSEPIREQIGSALLREFDRLANDETRAAIAVALGLAGHRAAADRLREALQQERHRDELAGYLCIGLAMMGAREAIDDIRAVVADSQRRPELLRQASIALGKLGDKQASRELIDMLTDGQPTLAELSAVAVALGLIGDRRSIEPLIAIIEDDKVPQLSRAFAAVGLGGVADDEALPWGTDLAIGVNYRAAVGTLTDGVAGVLDIL